MGLQARRHYLEDQRNERRRAEAEQAKAEARAARREAAGKHSVVQKLAQQNADLSEELSASAEFDRIDDQLAEVEAQAKRIATELLD